MGTGKDFEDALMNALEAWVGDQGVPMYRKQNLATRRGTFQANQETDIIVDSPNDVYYTGFEAKTRNNDSRAGIYFSQLSSDTQFIDQARYATRSGRQVMVAVEVRNYQGLDSLAWLTPLSLWVLKQENEETKVSWEECDKYGITLGVSRNYELTDELVQKLGLLDRYISDNRVRVLGDGNSPITSDELSQYRDGYPGTS